MSVCTLGFTVGPVQTSGELEEVCQVRAASYGHHIDSLRDALARPDGLDVDPHTTVFVARDKASGRALGSARVQTSAGGPLLIERCVALPDDIAGGVNAEISRMCALREADPLVKLVLYKATFLECLARQVRHMVIGARSESLVRQYKRLGFSDLHDGAQFELSYAGNLPHRVLAFDVQSAERRWFEGNHALHGFIFRTHHRDLTLFRDARLDRVALAA